MYSFNDNQMFLHMMYNFEHQTLQHGTLQTHPNWLNTTENFLQLQTEMKEPGLSKCWRLIAEDEMMKMQLQSALQLADHTVCRYSRIYTNLYSTLLKNTK